MRNWLIILFLLAAAFDTDAAERWVEGQHYFAIKPAQPTAVAPGKVEVTEVFSYGCPACYTFYPLAEKIKAALPANAQLNYLPASWNAAEQWPLFQRTYFTAQALGVVDKTHQSKFNAIWAGTELAVIDRTTNRPKRPAPTLDNVAAFYERVGGVKKADFIKMAASFSVEAKMKSADAAIIAMKVDQTPTMVVQGKYRYTVGSAGGPDQVVELTKWLVAKESK
jgi:thiol:disulfide interchange protein DsbA